MESAIPEPADQQHGRRIFIKTQQGLQPPQGLERNPFLVVGSVGKTVWSLTQLPQHP